MASTLKKYNPAKVESKWQKIWAKSGLYKTKDRSEKPKYYALDFFPYPSGAGLHVGHPKGYIATDVFSRFKILQGYNVLHPMGWDAFGLPAENYAIKNKIHPRISTERNIRVFKKQLEKFGFTYDWTREISSIGPEFYKWTQWIFLKMFEKELAYQSDSPVNWCPSCKTVLANEDLENGTCERCGAQVMQKKMKQWVLKMTAYADRLLYDLDKEKLDWENLIVEQQKNWIGRSEGAEVEFSIFQSIKKKILVGTRNEAKVEMIKNAFLSAKDIEIISLNDIPKIDDSELKETNDYKENAKRKAEFYYSKTGMPTISTDHIVWLEKWPKNKGIITHFREEAGQGKKASDEEVMSFVEQLIQKTGELKIKLLFSFAYADKNGVQVFESAEDHNILAGKRSNKVRKDYPLDSYIIDLNTGKYLAEQDDDKSYINFNYAVRIKLMPIFFKQHSSIKIYTTRVDTIFGCTYCVVAPEHTLIQKLKEKIENYSDVEEYIVKAQNKTELERTELQKEKTGVELKGIKAINPFTNEEIPVWTADYVLGFYGTGAVMAVPAHDERDFEFAKKYNLPIKQSIAQLFVGEGKDKLKEGKNIIERNVMDVIIKHWSEEKFYCLDWPKNKWKSFVIGGIEEGETKEDAAMREAKEETGYQNMKVVKKIGWEIHSTFFAAHKDVNRYAKRNCIYIKLVDGEYKEPEPEHIKNHKGVWVDKDKVRNFINLQEVQNQWDAFIKGEKAFIGDGVLINSGKYSGLISEEAREEMTKWLEEKGIGKKKVNYKMRDWVFSRQRYWGEPFPLIFCEHCKRLVESTTLRQAQGDIKKGAQDVMVSLSNHDIVKKQNIKIKNLEFNLGEILNPGWIAVNEKDLPVRLPNVKSYEPTGTGESPLANIAKWVNVKCPKCGGEAKRETNTMPQWAGSSWYYLRYIDPKNKKALVDKNKEKSWMPVDLYVGGAEHATRHLLYARFWHKFLYDIGAVSTKEPFKKLVHVGLVNAEDGRKMSKRWGNVVNPDDVIAEYGADSMRLYEMFMGPFSQTVSWSTKSVSGVRRFLDRVWGLAQNQKSKIKNQNDNGKIKNEINSKTKDDNLERLLNKTIKKVGEDIQEFKFNTAISALMILSNEFEKYTQGGSLPTGQAGAGSGQESLPEEYYSKFLILLSPFAPHIAEELWEKLGHKKSIFKEAWPKYDAALIKDETINLVISINGKARYKMEAKADITEEEAKNMALESEQIKKYVVGKVIKKIIFIKGRLINIVI